MAALTASGPHATAGGMQTETPPPAPGRLLPRIVAAAFLATILALALASWDIARGRVPETGSALVVDLLQMPENRRCSQDVSPVLTRHVRAGMTKVEAVAALKLAVVTPPSPWFWTPKVEDTVADRPDGGVEATRVIRYTAFGNQKLAARLDIGDGVVTKASGVVICPFG